MNMSNIHRQYVAKTVKPFVSPEGLATLRADLKDKDWMKVGRGQWDGGRVMVRQVGPDRFDIEINER